MHAIHSTHTHRSHCSSRSRDQCRTDIVSLLEPAYRPSSSTMSSYSSTSPSASSSQLKTRTYTDAWGNVHDPAYRLFPTEEWNALAQAQSSSRRSFDSESDEDLEEEEELEYLRSRRAGSGSGSGRIAPPPSPSFSSRRLPSSTSSPASTHRNLSWSDTLLASSGSSYPTSFEEDATPLPTLPRLSKSSKSKSTSTTSKSTKPKSKRKCTIASLTAGVGKRRPSHTWHDEEAEPEFDGDVFEESEEEEDQHQHHQRLQYPITPPASSAYPVVPLIVEPSSRPSSPSYFTSPEPISSTGATASPSPLDDAVVGKKGEEDSEVAPLNISNMKKRWQYVQLSVHLALFRAERRWKRRLSF